MTSLRKAFSDVDAAGTASDLFNGDKTKAQKVYRDLAKALHPDHVPTDKASEATAAFAKLSRLWAAYESGDADKPYWSTTIATRRRAYVTGLKVAEGDLTAVYEAAYREDDTTVPVVMKITRNAANNDLVENEAKVLRHLADTLDPLGIPYVSELLDAFKFSDAGSHALHQVNVLTPLTGFYTLTQVKAAYPDGLDIRDVLWMWKRLLLAIGHAHRAGVVHGAVTPDHVLIHPEQHGLCLVDWCYAGIEEPVMSDPAVSFTDFYGNPKVVPTGEAEFASLKAFAPTWMHLWPSKYITDKVPVDSKLDVAMASATMMTLFDKATSERFVRFAKACFNYPVEDAWALMSELTELAAEHFPRKFRQFSMPMAT